MAALADRDLHESLDKIIESLEQTAKAKIALTPEMIRVVSRHLATVRDCHKQLSEFEAKINDSDGKVVPIHKVRGVTA